MASSSGAGAAAANLNAVRETMDVLLEISRILNTGLDMETLSICVRLCEQGINPEALSSVIKELRKAAEALKFVCVVKRCLKPARKTAVEPDLLVGRSLYVLKEEGKHIGMEGREVEGIQADVLDMEVNCYLFLQVDYKVVEDENRGSTGICVISELP
ncbi:hypothetical protein EI555_015546 [Monodon monoceros]|uniref:Mitotic spindle organizing protein 1 n=1 Tax=Monodon monoceros TaxID=40151 RepID=A0A4U1F3B8_MONMO|nr:hypothetical protein EI555_015546 [Monodon monoceros]